MRHRLASLALGLLLVSLATAPAAAAYYVVAYAGPQSLLLNNHSVTPNGDSFWNGAMDTPVTIVYQGRLYIAVKYAAELAHLAISWLPRFAMVQLGGGTPLELMSSRALAPSRFSGPVAVQPRYLRLVVQGQEWTPAGRTFNIGPQRLPDALYTRKTTYMPLSLMADALHMHVTWPTTPETPPAATGLRVHIVSPVRQLQPGSVLDVRAALSGAPANDPIGYRWSLLGPDGLLRPMLGGDTAPQEQVPFAANASVGTYQLHVVVKDGKTGRTSSATLYLDLTGSPPANLQAPPFGFTPETIARAYNIYNTWIGNDYGQGNAIVLYERQGFSYADLSAFDNAFGLPAPSIRVETPGAPLAPGLEATMDIEWAHALAPLAQLVVVEDVAGGTASQFPAQLASSLERAAANGTEIASVSYGIPPGSPNQDRASGIFAQLIDHGMSVFAAGGDNFDTNGSPPFVWPAVDPSAVSVGGTTLFEQNPASFFETYWDQPTDASTFGESSEPASFWQESLTGDPMRRIPDVAFDGNPRTGVVVYLDGGWWIAGGTSLGAPAWAAIWALCRTAVPGLPAAPRALYAVAASQYGPGALHNPNQLTYDERTGIGSPDVANLISALRALY